MKDITLKITGKQRFKDVEEEQMEFVTDGRLYLKNDAVYLIYDESEVSGMKGCTTTIKVKNDSVKMRRSGKAGFNSEMYFEKGERYVSRYDTPFGRMEVEMLTDWVNNNIDTGTLTGSIDIGYSICLDGAAEGKNRIRIEIMQ